MKKTILLILIMFVLTGCTFEYNLKIDKKFINEEGNVKNFDKETWNEPNYLDTGKTYTEIINNSLRTYENVYKSNDESYINPYEKNDDYEYYNTEIIDRANVYGMKYFYKGELEKYKDTRMINMCYDSVDVKNDKNIFSIITSNVFSCFDIYTELDEVVINVTTDWNYKIVSSNADKEKDGKYTWIITKENASNKPITIELKRVFNWRLTLIIGIPILVVITIIYFVLKNKLAKKDQI